MKTPRPDIAALDTRPSRQFTSREAATILGATVGGLVQSAGKANALMALRWWVENWSIATKEMPDGHAEGSDAEIILVELGETTQ